MKKLVAVLAVALVAVGGGAIVLWRKLDAEHALNTDLQARMKEMETSRQSLASAFMRRGPAADNTAAPVAGAEVPAPPARRQQANQGAMENALSNARQTLATPEGRQAISGMVRAMIPLALPDVAKELNLNQAEADKLFELIAKQSSGGLDQLAGGGSVQDMLAKAQETQKTNEAQIAAQLGSKYPAWQEYQANLPMRQQVNQLQNSLAATGNKLDDSQTRPLIAALAAEQKRIDQDAGSAAAQGQTPQERRQQMQQRTAENNQRLVNTAASYMNPQQLESYKATLERQNAGRAALGGLLGGQGAAAAPPR